MQQTIFILGASSDIGRALAEKYLEAGWRVAGTYRNAAALADMSDRPNLYLYPCDITNPASIVAATGQFFEQVGVWDTFVSSIGTEEPIGRFFDCDVDAWESSVITNSTAQLRVLHQLYNFRQQGKTCNVVFFAGGGTNNPFRNYSAYCVSKIMLIKMCELLDDENDDLNVFIIGPGFVRTKIHQQTLDNPVAAGQNYERTLEFLQAENPGTSIDEIYDCINWCITQGKDVAGGRNFSVVHDPWRQGGRPLAEQLHGDPNKFKLRRFRNTD